MAGVNTVFDHIATTARWQRACSISCRLSYTGSSPAEEAVVQGKRADDNGRKQPDCRASLNMGRTSGVVSHSMDSRAHTLRGRRRVTSRDRACIVADWCGVVWAWLMLTAMLFPLLLV